MLTSHTSSSLQAHPAVDAVAQSCEGGKAEPPLSSAPWSSASSRRCAELLICKQEVDEALRQREEADESSDIEDETEFQYFSDNEGPTINDDDDCSDFGGVVTAVGRLPGDAFRQDGATERCKANKANREKVKYQQRTGSRSFVAHGHVLLQQEKYKDAPPTPFDLFKEFHCSSKTGFSENIKDAIVLDNV
ncbi:hypothetical protein EJB05_33226, partial [Eragrostis curvula]